jgi:hypothetical protein
MRGYVTKSAACAVLALACVLNTDAKDADGGVAGVDTDADGGAGQRHGFNSGSDGDIDGAIDRRVLLATPPPPPSGATSCLPSITSRLSHAHSHAACSSYSPFPAEEPYLPSPSPDCGKCVTWKRPRP